MSPRHSGAEVAWRIRWCSRQTFPQPQPPFLQPTSGTLFNFRGRMTLGPEKPPNPSQGNVTDGPIDWQTDKDRNRTDAGKKKSPRRKYG